MDDKQKYGAHAHSANHRTEVESSKYCGCFYCQKVYPTSKIVEWVDKDEKGIGTTALCPYCGIDSVIDDASGYKLDSEFLAAMHKAWF